MKTLEKLFRPSLTAENGEAISLLWVGDENRAVLMNPDSTRIFASVWHDGCRKYHPIIYPSLFALRRVRAMECSLGLRLRSFPNCGVELMRFRCESMDEVQQDLQELLAELRMI
jgi:hypothetical protein